MIFSFHKNAPGVGAGQAAAAIAPASFAADRG
jgi:hypothetical protein